MAIPVYALDLYPRDDPRDGTLIRTLTPQKAGWRDEANSTGSGFVEVRSTSDDGQAFDPRGLDYVRVRDTANGDRIVGGFFNDKARIKLLTKTSSKLLRVEGAGTLSYLARSVMAPHTYLDIAIGQDPIGGTWHLSQQGPAVGGNLLGSMLWRVIYEAQHYRVALTEHRHADGLIYTDSHADDRASTDVGIPDLVMGFDQFEDSGGNPWTLPSGEFKCQVNDNLLAVVKRLMEAGLYVELDPDTFELRAWEGTDHRRNLTSATWAADKVRLQAPTDGTIATGNILSDADREVAAHVKRRTLYVGQAGTYVKVTGSTDIPWEGGVNVDVEDPDALEQVGEAQLQARSDAGDTLKVRLKPGDDPTQGTYRAWEHVRPDDLITVHSGSDQWEYDEQDFPVAAISINLREGGDWDTWLELGSSFAAADRRFSLAPVPAHNHPPNPALCLPTTATAPTVESSGFVAVGTSAGAIVVPDDLTDSMLVVFGVGRLDDPPATASYGATSLTAIPDAFVDNSATGLPAMKAFYMFDPPPDPTAAGAQLQVLSAGASGNWKGYVVLSGVDQSDPFAAVAEAIGNSDTPSISIPNGAAAAYLNAVYTWTNNVNPADGPIPDTGQTEMWSTFNNAGSAGVGDNEFGGGYGDATPSWNLDSGSQGWVMLGLAINGSGTSGDSGPMPVGANEEADHGTSNRATRCDHVHPHSDLSDHDDETHHHASSVAFTPYDTLAATDVQSAIQELLDEAGGGGGATIIVREVGGTDIEDVAEVEFDADDFVVTEPSAGVARIALAAPGGGSADDPITDIFGAADTAYEFATSSLTGLTALGSPTAENADTTVPDHYFVRMTGAGYAWVGRYQAPPSTPYTVIAKISDSVARSNYHGAGIFLGVATPGNMDAFYVGQSTRQVWIDRATPTAFGSGVSGPHLADVSPPYYLAILVNSSTDVDYLFSKDGRVWFYVSEARNPGITIGSVGIAIKCENGSAAQAAAFDFLRIWNSAKTFPGV